MADSNQPTTLAGLISWIGAFVSLTDIDIMVRIAAGGVAICSGIMAIRYYYYNTKQIKKNKQ